jgi:Arc/MetJ-type ribon-helix-helix transcriptional regulator
MPVTTTVRLPEDLHEALRRRAFEERRAIADLIRDAVRDMLRSPPRASRGSAEADPLWQVIGTVTGGDPDESVEHDHYLYGTPRRKRTRR